MLVKHSSSTVLSVHFHFLSIARFNSDTRRYSSFRVHFQSKLGAHQKLFKLYLLFSRTRRILLHRTLSRMFQPRYFSSHLLFALKIVEDICVDRFDEQLYDHLKFYYKTMFERELLGVLKKYHLNN